MADPQAAHRWHVVVTGAKSRSHLVHIASYLRWVLSRSDVDTLTVSFVEAEAFLSAPTVSVAELAQMLPADDRLRLENGMPDHRFAPGAHALYVSVGAPGVSTLLALLRANPRRRFGVVVTDEGIGTYGSVATRRSAMERQGVRPARALTKALVISSVARLCTTTRWAAYRRTARGWSVASRIADEFRRYVAGAAPGTTNRAVVLTQPFADLELIDEAQHLAYVDAMCEAARDAGLDPVIRPHPAEDVAKYADRPLMTTRGTAELDPEVVSAALVLGGPSTALVNVSAMYGARVVWVSIPGLEYLDTKVSRRQSAILHAFLGDPVGLDAVASAVARRLADAGTPT